jgi:hypothetical protein
VNTPGIDPGSPAAGPVGGPSTVVASGAAVASAGQSGALAGNSAANLASANLVGLGVGPVGGVQEAGGGVAGSQAIQVSLRESTNPPVPMGLVSLVTLTRTGDPGETIGLDDHSGVEVASAVVVDLPQAPAGGPSSAGRVPRGDQAPEDVGAWWVQSPAPTRDVTANAAGTDGKAVPADQVTAAAPFGPSTGPGDLEGQGMARPGDAGDVDIGSLATADGPWFSILAAVGAITVYARRRQARRAAARQSGGVGDAKSSHGLFRLWGPSAARRPSHGIRSQQAPHAAMPRPNHCSRPRHMNNP